MIKNFDDEITIVKRTLESHAETLRVVLNEFGAQMNSSDELYEFEKRKKQLKELNKLIKTLKDGKK